MDADDFIRHKPSTLLIRQSDHVMVHDGIFFSCVLRLTSIPHPCFLLTVTLLFFLFPTVSGFFSFKKSFSHFFTVATQEVLPATAMLARTL